VLTLQVLRHVVSTPGAPLRVLLPLLALAAWNPGCGRSPESEAGGPEEEIESALNPTLLARALQRAGGGNYKAVLTEEMAPPVDRNAVDPAPIVSITTNTNLWMDRIGHYRLVESNDQDGGREVVLHNRQLAVALRYGKLIRRTAHEPEPTRFLEEALGGPWAAWEIARRFAEVKRTEDPTASPPAVVFTLSKAAVPRAVRGGFESDSPLRKWRETIAPQTLRGEVRLDKATGLVTAVNLETRFTLRRDGVPLSGAVRVEATLQNIGREKPISAPPAEELPTRQRTILEERALLGPKPGTDNSTRGR
jgi:hypothetical protein